MQDPFDEDDGGADAGAPPIDLHRDFERSGLESAALRGRIDEARAALAELDRRRGLLPTPGELEARDTEMRRALSEHIVALDQLGRDFAILLEELALAARRAGQLAAGERPHGYPEEGGAARGRHAGELAGLGDAFEAWGGGLRAAAGAATRARRACEAAADGFRARGAFFEELKPPE